MTQNTKIGLSIVAGAVTGYFIANMINKSKNNNNVQQSENYYKSKEFRKDQKLLLAENFVQTVSLMALFFFGIETIKDLKN